jgi:PEGA domain
MTTLRRALPGLYKGPSILALAALVCAALLLAGQPALASSHGGGGGGGHAGGGGHGGGGHASGGGSHMSSAPSGRGGPSAGFSGRTAHPIGPGTVFGPSRAGRGFRGGRFGDGRFFNDRFFHDRFFFGGFGYPWYGFGLGFGLGLGFAWDYPWGWGPGFYGAYGYYDPWWYGYGPGYGPGYYGGYDGSYNSNPRYGHDDMGALDIDIKPNDAEVYLNGEYIGRVRDFGGWRHGNLWLQKGTYDIVFYREGYKTLARQVTIYPGLVITWDDKMEPGQAVRPQDLPSKSHERRDSRLQFERDRAERIDREQQQRGGPYYDPRGYQGQDDGGGWSGNWRDRVNRDRGGAETQPQSNARPAPAPGPTVAAVTSDQYGRLHLKVEPEDASVYLDGRFVGTGSDLTANEGGLVLAPGRHKLAVVRPGRKAEEREFDSALGKDIDLTVNLSPNGGH